MPFAENLGTGGGSLDAQYGSSPTANTNAPLLLDPRTSGNFVYTPGSAGNYVAVPHSPSLNILGTEGTPFLSLPVAASNTAQLSAAATSGFNSATQLDLRAAIRAQSYQLSNQLLLTRASAASSAFRQFGISLASGTLGVLLSDGTTTSVASVGGLSPSVVPDGGLIAVRATWRSSDGRVQFFTKATSPATAATDIALNTGWTQLGTNQVGPTVALNATSFPLNMNGYAGASQDFIGDMYAAQGSATIDGAPLVQIDFTQQALGSRGFIESTGKLVSLVGNAAQIVDGTTYGFRPGVGGSYWSAPDSAALSITGDIDIRARISLNDWTPAAEQVLVGKLASTGDQRSYALRLTTGGTFYWTTSPDGIAGVNTLANAANTLTNGQTYWIRATLDVDDGAGNRVANFYYAPDSETEPTVWTSIGTTVTVAGATSIFDGTAALEVGSFNGGASPAVGRVYRAIIRGNLTSGTKAFDADFTRQLQFASSFTEGSANLATVTTVGLVRIERDRSVEMLMRIKFDGPTQPDPFAHILAKDGFNDGYRTYYSRSADKLSFGCNPGSGSFAVGATQTLSALGIDGSAFYWFKVGADVRVGNGYSISFEYAPDSPSIPTAWTPMGIPVTGSGAISWNVNNDPVTIGAFVTGSSCLEGSISRVIIRNGIDGSPVLDLDFSDAITTGSETYLPDTIDEVIPEALQYLPNLGWGGAALNARFGSAVGADTNDPLLLTHTGTNYLYLPGVAGNSVTFPLAASTTPTSSVDLRVAVAMDSWTPSGSFGQALLVNGGGTTRTYWLYVTSTGALELRLVNASSVTSTHTSTQTLGASPGALLGVRAVWTGSPAEVSFYVKQTTETTAAADLASNSGWSQVGVTLTASVPAGPLIASPFGLAFGVRDGLDFFAGKVYGIRVITDSVLNIDANFSTGITSGAQTTFTESSSNAATVTINRSTSGRKSVAVVQDVLLFGTDDYLEVPDNDLLDFGASDSFTVMTAVRQWATPASFGRFVSKGQGGTASSYLFCSDGTSQAATFRIDGTTGVGVAIGPAAAVGAMRVFAGVRATTADTVSVYLGSTEGAVATDNTIGTLANALPMRIGRDSVGTNYADMEFRGSAIWRRALTAAELALVNTHYTTGPTTASTALMQQAVWWVDAGTRSVAQINRSTSGRKSVACARCTWLLGTDDFFEVTDSPLWDFAQGQDYTLLVLHRGWWAQGTNDTLLATSSSTTASAAGWAMSNSSGDPWEAGGRHGDGSIGVTAVAPRRDVGALTGTFLVRDTATDTLTAFTGSTSGTPVTDTTTGTIGNTNVMRLGRLSTTGAEYLDAEVVAAVVWRRALTTAERNAVLAYYGV